VTPAGPSRNASITGPSGRRPGPDRSLTTAGILDSAIRLLDTKGLKALSMRNLAEEMGVGAMTLYSYIGGKAELLDGVGAVLFARMRQTPNPDIPWHENLAQIIREMHAALKTHPGALDLLLARTVSGPPLHHIRETLLATLREAGFGVQDAVHALTSLVSYALGFAVAEHALDRLGSESDRLARLQNLSAEEFPYLAEANTLYASHVTDEAFEIGLTHHINGIRGDLARAQKTGERSGGREEFRAL
jgi:AcrR family transcriptional regulator